MQNYTIMCDYYMFLSCNKHVIKNIKALQKNGIHLAFFFFDFFFFFNERHEVPFFQAS
jgi:hypothetical protein